MGLVVPRHREGRVLIAQPLQRGHELVVVGSRGRLDRHGEGRRGDAGRGTVTGWPLGANVSPVRVPFRRGMATKSPATTEAVGVVACPESVCSAWRRSSPRVRVLMRTVSGVSVPEITLHSDIFPVWLSVNVLVTREQHVAIGVVGNLGRGGPGQHGDGRHRAGCRAELLDQPGQPVHPDAGQARATQDGKDIARGDAAGQALRQLAVVDRLATEVALHEAVVADDYALDELFVHLVLLVDEFVGDGALVADRRDGPVDRRVRRRGVVVGGRVTQ